MTKEEMYREEVKELREYYGDHTDDLELAVSQLWDQYFGDEDDD